MTKTTLLMPTTHHSFPPNIIYTKDYLGMRRDNVIHFFSLDNEVVSQTTKDLLTYDKFSLEQVKKYKPNVGESVVFPNAKPFIFHLFVKSQSTESLNHAHLESSIMSLKHLMDSLNVKTVSISRNDNNIEPISWDSIENLLKKTLSNSQYTVTVCTKVGIIYIGRWVSWGVFSHHTVCLPRCSFSQRFLTRSRSISLSPSQNKSEPEMVGIVPSFWGVDQTELSA